MRTLCAPVLAAAMTTHVVCFGLSAEVSADVDVVIYGSSPAAIAAAVQAKRMGRTAVVVSPETRIGGMTTGGLGQTDIGSKSAFGGIALEFYKDVARWYAEPSHWKHGNLDEYFPDGACAGTKGRDSMWTLANHPRIPEGVRAYFSKWGTCRDDGHGADPRGEKVPSSRLLRGAGRAAKGHHREGRAHAVPACVISLASSRIPPDIHN